jgi:hypothetical protein
MTDKKKKPALFNKKYQQEWSETHKYKHIHTGEYCTFEAYVAEYLILRKAEAFKEPRPAYKFWTKGDKLYPAFIRQLKAVIKLRKQYSEETILGAIKSKYFEKIFFVGLYEKNYVGWKMNSLALEAIERYHTEEIELANQKELINKAKANIELTEEKKPVSTRNNQYTTNKKSAINNLRNL